jgi:Fe-S cluster assembly protein SufB
MGINEAVVRQISLSNGEPQWMLDHRLKSLAIFESMEKPTWGPSLDALDLQSIYYFGKAEGG